MRPALALIALLALSTLALPSTFAHDGPSIEVVAIPPDECPSAKSMCFEFLSQPPTLQPGDQVDIALYNDDETDHTAFVAAKADADPNHQDTDRNAALAFTNQVPPRGTSTENIFTVPEGVDTLYVWCDLGQHEANGMWLEVPVSGGASEEGNGAPGPGALFALAVVGLSALLLGRER
ncbi:MAG: hypothetical protein R3185_09135 [Candidatus Thermoplasmatota archaeon]|nr:hypothetical protein [Candidatus Thermoplasmatota archaeon]